MSAQSQSHSLSSGDIHAFHDALAAGRFDALLFDLDGVLTPTSDLHRRAWRMLFEPVLRAHGAQPYSEDDYFAHIDGRPRIDGVRALLEARGIHLAEGDPEDSGKLDTIYSMSEHKNHLFTQILEEEGIQAYPGTQAYLDYLQKFPQVRLAVVSSSKNAEQILQMANLSRYFVAVVDGKVAARDGIAGKPAPDTYVRAAEILGTTPDRAVVVEDAISGVAAGAAGGFAHTIGVNRGAGRGELADAGATLIVDDLAELVVEGEG